MTSNTSSQGDKDPKQKPSSRKAKPKSRSAASKPKSKAKPSSNAKPKGKGANPAKQKQRRDDGRNASDAISSADMLDRVKAAIAEAQEAIADNGKSALAEIPMEELASEGTMEDLPIENVAERDAIEEVASVDLAVEEAVEEGLGTAADIADSSEPTITSANAAGEDDNAPAEKSAPAVKGEFSDLPGILIAAAEVAPLAKTGGLADVVGALPKYLRHLGVDARIIMPFHRSIKERYRLETQHLFDYLASPVWTDRFVGIDKLVLDGITYYFVDNEFYYGGNIYAGDNFEGEQYGFFAQAVVDALPNLDFDPGIIHCNDWHTAVIPFKLKARSARTGEPIPRSLLTIHNLAYQGTFGDDLDARLIGSDERAYAWDLGSWNLMKAGIDTADKVNTVSPTYAWEITTPEFGEGLQHDLWWMREQGKLTGILNGIDNDAWDPMTDKCLPKSFGIDDMSGKRACKKALLKELDLFPDLDAPLIAMIGRLTPQKGISMAADVIESLVKEGAIFVILGSGYPDLEERLRDMEWRHHGRVCSYIGYNSELSHRIYAASDFFFMPSAFEPCGISQMIAMRYGSLPIVHETGGLKDTVTPYNQYSDEGDGFTFGRFDFWDAIEACKRALAVFDDKDIMNRLIRNAMSRDFSFDRCARSYAELYREMVG